jgi:hypothetical protein
MMQRFCFPLDLKDDPRLIGVQAASPEDLAGDYAEHQGCGHRGHGDLSVRDTHIYDYGSE